MTQALTLVSALTAGLVGGVFFAFSNFLMRALARLPAPHGITAMQSINIVVITPAFMTALFGTGLACLALGIVAIQSWQAPGSPYVVVGAIVYVVGVDLVTIGLHVPMNNALAAVRPESAEGARLWEAYLGRWTRWNHVRTAAALAASAALVAAMCMPR